MPAHPVQLESRSRRLPGKIVAVIAWAMVVVIGAWLVFAYSLPQKLDSTSPTYANLVAVAFFGRVLTFHLGLILTIAAAAALLAGRRRLAMLAVAMTVPTLSPTIWHARYKLPPSISGRPFRIMDMNIKDYRADGPDILTQVRRANPDIVAVEDPTPDSHRVFAKGFAGDYSYRTEIVPESGQGLAVYSRFPFLEKPQWVADKVQRLIRVAISIHGRPTVLWVVHPFSPRSLSRIIRNRVATAELARAVGAETLPVVMAGDFNFTDETPNQKALEDIGLTDAFDTGGTGRGATWPVRPTWTQYLPGVRIDHVFVSKELTCTSLRVGQYTGSDHLPIVADLGFKSP